MANKRNALAELAARLRAHAACAACVKGFDQDDLVDLGRASQIIEELSHVSDIPYPSMTGTAYTPHRIEAIEAIIKCRAIAAEEEGRIVA